ncbi:hypothetical protein PU088_004074, partial [Citrobacter farmeri]|nr:hypothetical protein [Citrobacter farmeri]
MPAPVISAPRSVKKHKPKATKRDLSGIQIAPVSEKETAALHKSLSDAQTQIATLQQQLQSANQQLAERENQLAALHDDGEQDKSNAAAVQQKQLAENLNEINKLKTQLTDLLAEKVANSLEFATEKTRDNLALTQLKKLLTESQNQGAALNKQIAALAAEQTANARALA